MYPNQPGPFFFITHLATRHNSLRQRSWNLPSLARNVSKVLRREDLIFRRVSPVCFYRAQVFQKLGAKGNCIVFQNQLQGVLNQSSSYCVFIIYVREKRNPKVKWLGRFFCLKRTVFLRGRMASLQGKRGTKYCLSFPHR